MIIQAGINLGLFQGDVLLGGFTESIIDPTELASDQIP
jgi:hypothetical protein